MSRVVKLSLAASLTASLALLPAGPGVAAAACDLANPCSFDVSTDSGGASANSNPGGRAIARGTISFATVRNVSIQDVEVIDKCNGQGTGDGLGAYMLVQADFGNGAEYIQRMPTPFKDVDGCNNGGYTSPGIAYTGDSGKIRRARIQLFECDGSNGTPTLSTCYDSVFSAWKDNPHFP